QETRENRDNATIRVWCRDVISGIGWRILLVGFMASISTASKPDLGSLRIHEGQRKSRGIGKYIAIAVFVLVVLGGLAGAILKLGGGTPVVETAVATKPEIGGAVTALNASGYVTPRRRATIAAKITGRVTSVHFDEGTRVAEGQLLATLDDSDAQRSLAA